MRLISWKFWGLAALLLASWITAGYFFDTNPTAVDWLSKIGVLGQVAMIVVFVVVYTILGLRGAAKWWRTDLGSRLVLFPVTIAAPTLVLAWAIFFHGGQVNTPLSAWIYVGGYLMSVLVLGWGTWLWLRTGRDQRGGHDDHENEAGTLLEEERA